MDCDERFPSTRSGQLDHHASTIERLRSYGNDPIAALRDDAGLTSAARSGAAAAAVPVVCANTTANDRVIDSFLAQLRPSD
jgi:hypothetical protein